MARAERPLLSVGIPAYNAARTLPRLLESLLGQRGGLSHVEIVVADNGSTDNTLDVLRQYAAHGPIRIVDASHRRGPSAARNAVVGATAGEIIAFIDADCVAHADWLAELKDRFDDPAVGCVAGAIDAADAVTPTERFYARHGVLSQDYVLAHTFLPYVQTANAAFRRAVFARVGGFDESLLTCEDADLLWRMQLQTELKLVYRPSALVWHRHRGTPRGLLKQTMGWGAGQAHLARKYRDRMPREPRGTIVAAYRRWAGLASLSLRRWVGLRLGRVEAEAWNDARLALLYQTGIRLGRLRGSLGAGVFYP